MDSTSLVYYPNPPIPLNEGLSPVNILDYVFVEPFSAPGFDDITPEEQIEVEEIQSTLIDGELYNIPTRQSIQHEAPKLNYPTKDNHNDGYEFLAETLGLSEELFVDSLTQQIGNIKHDETIHKLLIPKSEEELQNDQQKRQIKASINSFEQEKARFEVEKKQFEYERKQFEEQRRQFEEEKRQFAELKSQIEEEGRKNLEEELRKQLEKERKQIEDERRKLENERKQFENERKEFAKSSVAARSSEHKPAGSTKNTTPRETSQFIKQSIQKLNIRNPGGAPTTLKHMRRIANSKLENEAVVSKPSET